MSQGLREMRYERLQKQLRCVEGGIKGADAKKEGLSRMRALSAETLVEQDESNWDQASKAMMEMRSIRKGMMDDALGAAFHIFSKTMLKVVAAAAIAIAPLGAFMSEAPSFAVFLGGIGVSALVSFAYAFVQWDTNAKPFLDALDARLREQRSELIEARAGLIKQIQSLRKQDD
jgi:hypothetical protein